jgi:hypothetical protein
LHLEIPRLLALRILIDWLLLSGSLLNADDSLSLPNSFVLPSSSFTLVLELVFESLHLEIPRMLALHILID